jgi:hypothetical protein
MFPPVKHSCLECLASYRLPERRVTAWSPLVLERIAALVAPDSCEEMHLQTAWEIYL